MPSIVSKKPVLQVALFSLAISTLSLTACDSVKPSQDRAEELTLYDFTSAMRWGDFDSAYDFVDPKTKIEHPLSDIDKGRFKQVEVSGYDVVATADHEGTIDRQVKLSLINRNTQIPRSISYHEHWTWDATQKRWWLTSGLPDISPQD
ncbi:MAG TPA: hypothetical protein VK753_10060 [Xanthomonadaceae bacterium]|jgi:hypothetical protein|nr:hypothetical protein [Xanthomonadaceae bacterium]